MRVLVTGGAGFIGSNLVESLVDQGDEVMVIDDLSTGRIENLANAKCAELVEASILSDLATESIKAWMPETVFHLAAQMDVRRSVREPVFDGELNIIGTIRVAQAAIEAGTQNLVFASTGGAIYGEQQTFPAGEAHPTRPVSPYGTSKLCAENYLRYFSRTCGIRTIFLRYGNVYGPRQDPHGEAGVVAIFAGRMLACVGGDLGAAPPVINGDGKQTRDYVFVADVVRANIAAAATACVSGALNIGTGIETDVNTLAAHIADAAIYSPTVERGPAAAGEQRRSVLDISRAIADMDWQPSKDIADGLAETVQWFRQKRGQLGGHRDKELD